MFGSEYFFLGCSKDRECNSNLLEERGECAEGVEEPQPALPHPPVVIDHQRLMVKDFISTLLFSVVLYLFSLFPSSNLPVLVST